LYKFVIQFGAHRKFAYNNGSSLIFNPFLDQFFNTSFAYYTNKLHFRTFAFDHILFYQCMYIQQCKRHKCKLYNLKYLPLSSDTDTLRSISVRQVCYVLRLNQSCIRREVTGRHKPLIQSSLLSSEQRRPTIAAGRRVLSPSLVYSLFCYSIIKTKVKKLGELIKLLFLTIKQF